MRVKRNLRILTKISQVRVHKVIQKNLDDAEIVSALKRAERKSFIRKASIADILEEMEKVKELDSVNTIICKFYGNATLGEMQKFANSGFPEQSNMIITMNNSIAKNNKHEVVLCWEK